MDPIPYMCCTVPGIIYCTGDVRVRLCQYELLYQRKPSRTQSQFLVLSYLLINYHSQPVACWDWAECSIAVCMISSASSEYYSVYQTQASHCLRLLFVPWLGRGQFWHWSCQHLGDIASDYAFDQPHIQQCVSQWKESKQNTAKERHTSSSFSKTSMGKNRLGEYGINISINGSLNLVFNKQPLMNACITEDHFSLSST
jgi:hypothetical protein